MVVQGCSTTNQNLVFPHNIKELGLLSSFAISRLSVQKRLENIRAEVLENLRFETKKTQGNTRFIGLQRTPELRKRITDKPVFYMDKQASFFLVVL
jgi:hypothetical protein